MCPDRSDDFVSLDEALNGAGGAGAAQSQGGRAALLRRPERGGNRRSSARLADHRDARVEKRESLVVSRARRPEPPMDNDRWNHVDQLLQSALDIPAVERDAYLRNACGGDRRLEDEVRSLLAAHDRADRFLGAPAIDLAARELAGERSDDGSQAGGDPLIGQTLSHYRIVEKWAAAAWAWCTKPKIRGCTASWRSSSSPTTLDGTPRPWAGSRARRRRRRRSTTRTSAPSTTSASRTGGRSSSWSIWRARR